MKKSIGFLLICTCLLCAPKTEADACSIFSFQSGPAMYFCGNEDWSAQDAALLTVPAKGNALGVVLFGWYAYLPGWAQAGINSAGLCFDWASVPPQQFTGKKNKQALSVNDTLSILQKCRTVQDVLAYVEQHDFPHLAEEHLMFADPSGDSCVLEFTKGAYRVIRKTDSFLAVTNFNLTDKEAGWYPCERYNAMTEQLQQTAASSSQTQKALKAQFSTLLDRIHQEGAYPTIYSYIMDLQKMEIQLFYRHDFSKSAVYSVANLLKKEQKLLLANEVR